MELDAYLYTNPGGRQNNEDSADCRIEEDGGLFVLADGLGGHRDGAMASEAVVRTFMERWEQREISGKDTDPELGPWLTDSVEEANRVLLDMQKERGSNMKSTVVALAMDKGRCVWAHVGDSRLYYLTCGQIYQVTPDHSVSYKKYLAGEIEREEINFDDDRSSLLRVVGDPARCIPVAGEPEGGGLVCPGDAFLLCSDGFWEYMNQEEILIDFLKAGSPEHWAELMLLRILPRLTQGTDNLTLLTVFVE